MADSSWRMRGSGRMSTAAKGTSRDCRMATVRAEKPQAGASGVPFMNRITFFSPIASAIASRIGFDSSLVAGTGWGSLLIIGTGSNWLDMGSSWLSVGLVVRRGLGLQGEGVDRSADLPVEDLVDETVLLDAAAPLERGGRDGRAEMVPSAGVVLDLDGSARNRGLDAVAYVLHGRHRTQA